MNKDGMTDKEKDMKTYTVNGLAKELGMRNFTKKESKIVNDHIMKLFKKKEMLCPKCKETTKHYDEIIWLKDLKIKELKDEIEMLKGLISPYAGLIVLK